MIKIRKLDEFSTLLLGLAIIYGIHQGMNAYSRYSEIEDFSYASLRDNITAIKTNQILFDQLADTLSDNKIVGYEYKDIVESYLEVHSSFGMAHLDSNHSAAKRELQTEIIRHRTTLEL